MSSNVKRSIIIIILIILIIIFVNSLVGKDGFFFKRKEEKTLIELSKVLHDIEENIADIKANNGNNILSSGQMLEQLESRELITLTKKGVMQGEIINSKVKNIIINYNGDVYLDNYKRGTLPLSSNISEMKYKNPFNINQMQSLKVIDGDIVEDKNGVCWICSMIGRNDFACWINESGEMVSIEKNMPFSYESQDTEYIALYNNDLKNRFANRYVINTTSNVYVKDSKILFNLISYNYYQRTVKNGYAYNSASQKYVDAYIGRTLINSFGIYISDNYENLIDLKGENIASFNLSDLADVDIKNYSNGLSLSVLNCEMDAINLKEQLEQAWGKSINRIYYRAGVDANYYQREQDTDLTEEEILSFCLEPAIKYIDFE